MDRPTEALERMRVCTTNSYATLLPEDYARVLEWVAHLDNCRQELREAIDFDEECGEGAAYGGREGCDECIPGGRGVLCPDCEEAREDDSA